MKTRVKIDVIRPQLKIILKAIEKGVGEDIRDYKANNDMATNNAIRMMRSDCINTNLRDSAISETMELKFFRRSAWEGCLLIDRPHQYTISICTKKTLESIARKPNRHIPHYLQTILYAENSDVEATYHQMNLLDFESGPITKFSDDDYRYDYERIMDDEISFDDGYTHLVVVYEADKYDINYAAVRLLDKDLDTAYEYSLMDLLHPNFGDLTQDTDEKQEKKDAHSLVTVKSTLQKQDIEKKGIEPEITIRKEERESQA